MGGTGNLAVTASFAHSTAMKLVTVFVALESAEAELVRGRLESAGFAASLAHETGTFSPEGQVAAGGIYVQVPEDAAAEARALLDSDATVTE